ncbi:MAG: hypothetical protein AM325_016380 [Candidatus Thorarchaeota archaeon SMTZ1-45]
MKNYRKWLMIALVIGMAVSSFSVIYANGQSATSNSACKIFPRVTPAGSFYPANADVLHSFQVGVDGNCDDACGYCDQLGTHCVDLYGCDCYSINGLQCTGSKHPFSV